MIIMVEEYQYNSHMCVKVWQVFIIYLKNEN